MATRKKRTGAKTAPQANANNEAATVAAKTENATTENNPVSTTSAADTSRGGSFGPEGATTGPENGNTGAAPGETEQAKGERHSHPAETTAERTLRQAGITKTGSLEMPAGEFADPSKHPEILEGTLEKTDGKSSQDESGALQDATREAIGAGNGAPDGVGDDEVIATEGSQPADEIEPVKVNDNLTFHGNKAKLWRMIEKGATHDEMREATKYNSAIGTIYVMAEQAGREIVADKDKKGIRTYKLAPEKKAGK